MRLICCQSALSTLCYDRRLRVHSQKKAKKHHYFHHQAMFRTFVRFSWVGGVGAQPGLSSLRSQDSKYVGIDKEVVRGNVPAEARRIYGADISSKGRFVLCPRIYDDLLKLPLRFKMHPYEDVVKNLDEISGYGLPLGPADRDDILPFHIHRNANGKLPGLVHSINERALAPAFITKFRLIDGDLFRFEDELIKIFPTKKTFVRNHEIVVYNSGKDSVRVAHHWMLGLGF